MTTRWVITGSRGQLGRCLVESLEADPGCELVASHDASSLDITDPTRVAAIFEGLVDGPPDFLVNAAAFTAVDRCESERERAQQVNGHAPGLLAEACRSAGVQLAHLSTDYVFDGKGARPYREDDPVGPTTTYGASKLEGERLVLQSSPDFLVVRTAWVFGPGRNFVKAILRQAQLRRRGEVAGPLRVVADQLGCPTYAADLGQGLVELLRGGATGLYHLCNAEPATWAEFARAILDETGFGDLEIEAITTEELDLPAPRPRYSVLDCSRAAERGVALRRWREALVAYLDSADGRDARSGVEA